MAYLVTILLWSNMLQLLSCISSLNITVATVPGWSFFHFAWIVESFVYKDVRALTKGSYIGMMQVDHDRCCYKWLKETIKVLCRLLLCYIHETSNPQSVFTSPSDFTSCLPSMYLRKIQTIYAIQFSEYASRSFHVHKLPFISLMPHIWNNEDLSLNVQLSVESLYCIILPFSKEFCALKFWMCVVSTETDGCASTAQPISPSEGEGNKTGMSSARESGMWHIETVLSVVKKCSDGYISCVCLCVELQQPFSSKVGSPLKEQLSVPANMVPNAPVPTERPAPSKPSANS